MDRTHVDEARLKQYLLGELSEDECVAVEEEYFADQELLSRLLEVEDELIDQYHGGRLAAAERVRFEKQFLSSPASRRKVELARDLRELHASVPGVAGRSSRSGAWLGSAAALAAVLILAVSSTLWLTRGRGGEAPTEPGSGKAAASASVLPSESPGSASPAAPAPAAGEPAQPLGMTRNGVLSVTLAAGLLRGSDEVTAFAVPPSTRTVRLSLPLARDDFPRYRAALQSAEGQEIAAETSLSSRSEQRRRVVAFSVSAALLSPRTYVVILTGLSRDGSGEPAGEYVFRVTRP